MQIAFLTRANVSLLFTGSMSFNDKRMNNIPHCAICDRPMDDMRFDARDGSAIPCSTCNVAIDECLDGYDSEDQLGAPWIESDISDFDEEIRDERRLFSEG